MLHLECWDSADHTETTLTTPENIEYLRSQGLLSADAVFQYAIHADTWTECMTIHHRLQGWKPYVPFGDDEEDDGEGETASLHTDSAG